MLDKLGKAGYGDLQLIGSQGTIPGHQYTGFPLLNLHSMVWVFIVALTPQRCR